MIDIGANLTKSCFADDLDEVLSRAWAAGLEHIVVTGIDIESSRQALALSEKHPGRLSATAGLHPHHAGDWNADTASAIEGLVQHPALVAIGETGLDYFRDLAPRPVQQRCFEAQLAMGADCGKPLFLHQRDAGQDFLAILREWRHGIDRAVVHCFTDHSDILHACLDLDLHIGITGWICDERRGGELAKLVRDIPADRLMIETDAPYLLPRDLAPKPTSRRNEPAHLPHVADTIARHRGEDPVSFRAAVTRNSRLFFGLD